MQIQVVDYEVVSNAVIKPYTVYTIVSKQQEIGKGKITLNYKKVVLLCRW